MPKFCSNFLMVSSIATDNALSSVGAMITLARSSRCGTSAAPFITTSWKTIRMSCALIIQAALLEYTGFTWFGFSTCAVFGSNGGGTGNVGIGIRYYASTTRIGEFFLSSPKPSLSSIILRLVLSVGLAIVFLTLLAGLPFLVWKFPQPVYTLLHFFALRIDGCRGGFALRQSEAQGRG